MTDCTADADLTARYPVFAPRVSPLAGLESVLCQALGPTEIDLARRGCAMSRTNIIDHAEAARSLGGSQRFMTFKPYLVRKIGF